MRPSGERLGHQVRERLMLRAHASRTVGPLGGLAGGVGKETTLVIRNWMASGIW